MSAIIKKAQASNKVYSAKSKKQPSKKDTAAKVVMAFDTLLEKSEIKDVPAMGPAFDEALNTTTEDAVNFLRGGGKGAETSLTEGVWGYTWYQEEERPESGKVCEAPFMDSGMLRTGYYCRAECGWHRVDIGLT